ncbi:6527_t:CDS:1, partial [Gigaspora rosea]
MTKGKISDFPSSSSQFLTPLVKSRERTLTKLEYTKNNFSFSGINSSKLGINNFSSSFSPSNN